MQDIRTAVVLRVKHCQYGVASHMKNMHVCSNVPTDSDIDPALRRKRNSVNPVFMLRFNFFVWFLGVLVLAQDPSVFKMEPMESDQPLFVRRTQEITEGISRRTSGEQCSDGSTHLGCVEGTELNLRWLLHVHAFCLTLYLHPCQLLPVTPFPVFVINCTLWQKLDTVHCCPINRPKVPYHDGECEWLISG